MMRTVVLVENLKKLSRRCTKILFCGRGLKFFSPQVTNLKRHIISCHMFLGSVPVSILKGTGNAPAVDLKG